MNLFCNRLILFTLCSPFFYSCIKCKQIITLKKDGSAQIEIFLNLTQKQERLFILTQKSFLKSDKTQKNYLSPLFNEKTLRTYLKKKYIGVDIHSFRYQKIKKLRYYYLKLDITNLSEALKQNLLNGARFNEHKNNQWLFSWKIPKEKNKIINSNLLKNLNLELIFKAPEKIINSNGKKISDKQIFWIINQKNFTKLVNDDTFFSALIKGDFSIEKKILEKKKYNKFFGIDE